MSKGYGSIQTEKGEYRPLGRDSEDLSAEFLEKNGAPSPEDDLNIFSKVLFWWCNTIVRIGYKRPLEHADLPAVSEKDDVVKLSREFEENWQQELKLDQPSLVRALRKYG